MNRLGALIKSARELKKLTQVELGQKAGLSQATISQIENGAVQAESGASKVLASLGFSAAEVGTLMIPLFACPGGDCAGAWPFLNGSKPAIRPQFFYVPDNSRDRLCRYCSALLISHCGCGCTVFLGVCCPACGKPYAEPSQPIFEKLREEFSKISIAELRSQRLEVLTVPEPQWQPAELTPIAASFIPR